MKNGVLTIAFIAISFLHSYGQTSGQKPVIKKQRSGVAVLLTGAAARIPQQAALLEELYKRGMLQNVVFIAGVSSGALNSVLLNGILSGRIRWYEYKQILYSLKNKDIFLMDAGKIPVNTIPARQLYTRIFQQKLGYFKIGDLPITTEISVTHISELGLKRISYRLCSRKINQESDTTLNLVDIAMASTAFPVFFPSVRIKNVKTIPDVEYVDGGLGDDQIPYHALLEFEKFRGYGVEKVYIVSIKTAPEQKLSEELKELGLDDNGFLSRTGFSIDALLKKRFIKSLTSFATEAPELIPRTYVWVPEFSKDYRLFNFENLQEQYTLTQQWARTSSPVKLGDYLLPYILQGR